MAAFIAEDLQNIVQTIMRKFMKEEFEDSVNGTKLANIYLKRRIYCMQRKSMLDLLQGLLLSSWSENSPESAKHFSNATVEKMVERF